MLKWTIKDDHRSIRQLTIEDIQIGKKLNGHVIQDMNRYRDYYLLKVVNNKGRIKRVSIHRKDLANDQNNIY